jgi:hypothetical protein
VGLITSKAGAAIDRPGDLGSGLRAFCFKETLIISIIRQFLGCGSLPRTFSMATPMSKQERIRLNQQRSRARKQEYLQDLEKRVQDCHATCREADLQRDSYQRLCKENAKLRALLASVGIGESQIDAYVNSDTPEPPAEQTSLRHIRPKLQSDILPSQPMLLGRVDSMNDQLLPVSNQNVPTLLSSTPSSACTSTCASTRPEIDETPLTSASTLGIPQPQYCDIFHAYYDPTRQPTANDTVLCSQARDLIDQYNISGHDMQHITFRLAPGFGPEINPGEGCRVNRQLLFDVLNDISTNLS